MIKVVVEEVRTRREGLKTGMMMKVIVDTQLDMKVDMNIYHEYSRLTAMYIKPNMHSQAIQKGRKTQLKSQNEPEITYSPNLNHTAKL